VSKQGYSEYLWNLIPPCPRYVKRVSLVKALAEVFGLSREKAEQSVDSILKYWKRKNIVKKSRLKGYVCRENGTPS